MKHLAFVFPGQGSQSLGMMNALFEHYPLVKDPFEKASEILGYDLWSLVSEGPVEQLNQTECAQPALLVAGVAMWELFLAQGGKKPAVMAGHSLGEYTALVCAGALDFSEAVRLVQQRGQAMQAAVPVGLGAMAAVLGLGDQDVIDICDGIPDHAVSAANFNSPGQVVIAGKTEAVNKACELLKTKGGKIFPLAVSVPSHCHLMKPAAEKMAQLLEKTELKPSQVPVIHNVDARIHESPAAMKQALIQQLTSPVRWVDSVNAMRAMGVTTLVECGPGKVLTGLNKRIDKDLCVLTINTQDGLLSALK